MEKKRVIIIAIVIVLIFVLLGVIGFLILAKSNDEEIKLNVRAIKKYDISNLESFIDDSRYIPVYNNGKYGYINQEGVGKISCEYDIVSAFGRITVNGKIYQAALVCKDGKFGYITKNNQTMFFDNKLNNNLKKIYDQMNSTIAEEYGINNLSILFAAILEAANYDFVIDERVMENRSNEKTLNLDYENNYYKYYSSNYSLQIQSLESNYDDYVPSDVTLIKNGETITNNEFIFVDYDGDNKYFITLYDDGYVPFCNLEEHIQGWYDKDGNRVICSGKFEILNVRDNIMLMHNYDDSNNLSPILFLDLNGNVLLQGKQVEILDQGYLIRKDNDKVVLIDNKLKTISQKEYDEIIFSWEIDRNSLSSCGPNPFSGMYKDFYEE